MLSLAPATQDILCCAAQDCTDMTVALICTYHTNPVKDDFSLPINCVHYEVIKMLFFSSLYAHDGNMSFQSMNYLWISMQ